MSFFIISVNQRNSFGVWREAFHRSSAETSLKSIDADSRFSVSISSASQENKAKNLSFTRISKTHSLFNTAETSKWSAFGCVSSCVMMCRERLFCTAWKVCMGEKMESLWRCWGSILTDVVKAINSIALCVWSAEKKNDSENDTTNRSVDKQMSRKPELRLTRSLRVQAKRGSYQASNCQCQIKRFSGEETALTGLLKISDNRVAPIHLLFWWCKHFWIFGLLNEGFL